MPIGEQLSLCNTYREKWLCGSSAGEEVEVFSSVKEAVDYLQQKGEYNVLVTGSLHLVGAILSLLNPDLKGKNKAKKAQSKTLWHDLERILFYFCTNELNVFPYRNCYAHFYKKNNKVFTSTALLFYPYQYWKYLFFGES